MERATILYLGKTTIREWLDDNALRLGAALSYYTDRMGQMEHTGSGLKKKMKLTRWGYRIVKLLGVKTSAKLGWKGFKIKKKVDELTNKNEAA